MSQYPPLSSAAEELDEILLDSKPGANGLEGGAPSAAAAADKGGPSLAGGGAANQSPEEDDASGSSIHFCLTLESPFRLNKNKAASFEDIRFQAKFTTDSETKEISTFAVPDEAFEAHFLAQMVSELRGEGGDDEDGGEGDSSPLRSVLEPIPHGVDGAAYIMHDDLLVMCNTDSAADRDSSSTSSASSSSIGIPASLGALFVGASSHVTVPNMYQKIIDMLLRLQARGLRVRPEGMLARVEHEEDVPTNDGGRHNFYQGYHLVKARCFISPDEDELYVKINMPPPLMASFAESRALFLPTNAYSFAGGRSLIYSQKTEAELVANVTSLAGTGKVVVPAEYLGWGFLLTPPILQRIFVRFIREPWRFGGCGIQVSEMIAKHVIIKHFFPLHSAAQMEAKGITEWAAPIPRQILHPMRQSLPNILHYFGEEVALYFFWLKRYNIVLLVPAIIGIAMGAAAEALPKHREIIHAGYAAACVGTGVFWNLYWIRLEAMFSTEHQLDDVEEQATVRDLFEGVERSVDDEKLFKLDFESAPAFNVKSDGSLVEVYYPPWKQKLIRYCVSYPLVLTLTAVMTGLLCLNTHYRLESEDNGDYVQYLCTFIAVAIPKVFDIVFGFIIEQTSWWENSRTDEEDEYQQIIKKFFYYFLSSYFSLLALLFWPADSTPDNVRVDALRLQMITNCVIMPLVQNVMELLLPWAKARLRVNIDCCPDSAFQGLVNTLKGWTAADYPSRCLNKEAEGLWLETQKEPLPSMGNDYLELSIQFGYITMFAVVFPWAPIVAFFYNIVEMRLDAAKVTWLHQRPLAKPVKSIGAWKMIFSILSIVSIVTNAFVASVMTDALSVTNIELTPKSRYQSFAVIQYILIAVAALVYVFTPIVPGVKSKTAIKQSILMTRNARVRNKEPDVVPITMESVRRGRRWLRRREADLRRRYMHSGDVNNAGDGDTVVDAEIVSKSEGDAAAKGHGDISVAAEQTAAPPPVPNNNSNNNNDDDMLDL